MKGQRQDRQGLPPAREVLLRALVHRSTSDTTFKLIQYPPQAPAVTWAPKAKWKALWVWGEDRDVILENQPISSPRLRLALDPGAALQTLGNGLRSVIFHLLKMV